MSDKASQLKAEWMAENEKCFEPMTFGELKVGQKFIGLPLPGDNHGHGGFRKAHYIYKKTRMRVTTEGYANPHGTAKRRNTESPFPDSLFVIVVE